MASVTNLINAIVRRGPDGLERVVRGLEWAATPREVSKTRSVSVPDWVVGVDSGWALKTKEKPPFASLSIQPYDRGQIDHFFCVAGGPSSITVAPESPFQAIDLTVLDTVYVDRFHVEATFETTGGDEVKRTKTLSAGDFFSARYVPMRLSIDEPARRASVELHSSFSPPRFRELLFRLVHRPMWKEPPDPWLTIPRPRADGGTPILLISVDTFRYDYLHTFEPLISELGEAAVVPAEPRTQGYCTQPAHGSLFTGVHPTVHGNFSNPTGGGQTGGIDRTLVTIPEILSENLYKCSGCGSEEKIGPKNGFGDGMDRFRHYPVSWDDRVFDGADIANAVIEWIRVDAQAPSRRLFYFLHFFDPHYPYIPPQPSEVVAGLDYELVDRIRDSVTQRGYLKMLDSAPIEFSETDLETLQANYEASLEYTAFQICRVIRQLKHTDLFDDAFILITGDHGEEFFERKFWGHSTLYDANIRPGMIVKPPDNMHVPIRDNVDLIDLLPTIAELIGTSVPDQCTGVPLQQPSSGPRFTERHGRRHYNVSVEEGGVKGIFTYNYEFPGRPTREQIEDGPERAEFYRLSNVRSGVYHDCADDIELSVRSSLRSSAESFVLSTAQPDYDMSGEVHRDVAARLERLGYK